MITRSFSNCYPSSFTLHTQRKKGRSAASGGTFSSSRVSHGKQQLPCRTRTYHPSARRILDSPIITEKSRDSSILIDHRSSINVQLSVLNGVSPRLRQISPPSPAPPSHLHRPIRPRLSIPINHHSEGLLMAKNRRKTRKKRIKQNQRPVKRIDVLPDDVLLGIFDFYMIMYPSYGDKTDTEAWQSLVHVCRRWRSLVFLSPRRLNLRLFCTPETPARNTLDVWPTLPLIIKGTVLSSTDSDNVIAALEQSNRICQVKLRGLGRQEVLAAMQVTFPELTELLLVSRDDTMPVIPDSFLDGSAPRRVAFHFRGCQNCFCLPRTSSTFGSPISPIPGTFHPKRWSLPSALCPASERFPLNSDPLNLALTGEAKVFLHQNALSSPLSTNFISKALPNI
ncbi:hypothetical protein V8E52_006843 [Russula decolorans]